MKRFISFMAILGLLLVFGIGAPGTVTHAEVNSNSNNTELQQSRVLTHGTSYPGNVVPPPTYPYNDGLWSGTLSLVTYQFDGTRTLATYRGTVYCSGNCPIPPNLSNK